ncbi:uncharacterized protein LOC131951012, partial [Physella acuta]|uniref:uncharacterized protein LOC131951012 n=1 Tax=Physella acuta TaxID=109671 RepID=UPI0027DDB923
MAQWSNIREPPPSITEEPGTTNATPPFPASTYYVRDKFSPLPESLTSYCPPAKKKSLFLAYVLALSPLGLLGAHHFYLKRRIWGKLYACTLGLLGVGYFVDWFRIPWLVREYNYPHKRKQLWKVSEAYILWLPFGLLGFHRFYLGHYSRGITYALTFGLCGFACIRDLFKIPILVKTKNTPKIVRKYKKKSIYIAYLLYITGGIFGIHHWYLKRSAWSILYQITLGFLGLGCVLDFFRIPSLVSHANDEISGKRLPGTACIVDAYQLWFFFGLLGFHHFYLNRVCWGILYFFTLGILGIGWLVDFVRLPYLVEDFNKKLAYRSPSEAPISTVAPTHAVDTTHTVDPTHTVAPTLNVAPTPTVA